MTDPSGMYIAAMFYGITRRANICWYHTDSWGTKNTATGEFWGGQPYNYIDFKGENPKYNEQMTPIDSRQIYEGYIRGRK